MWNNILSIGKNLRQGLQVGAKAVTNELKYGAKVIKNEVDYTFNNKTDPIGKRPKEALANTVGQITQGLAKEFPVETEALTMATQAVSPIIKSVTDQAEWEAEQGNISPMATLGHGIRTIRGTGNAGAHLAHHTGVDQDIGRFIGEGVADSVLTAGVGKASKALRRSTPLTIGGGPKPALAGATSGRNTVSINPGANPNLSPQVMEAVTAKNPEILALGGVKRGDDIITPEQAKHLTRRAGEVQKRVDQLPLLRDQLNNMVMEGADPRKLKNLRDRIEDTKTMLHRKRSNVSVPTKEDPLYYKTAQAKLAKKQEELQRGLETGEYLEQHHLFPKVVSSAFFDRMDWMINKGLAEADDLVLMNEVAIKLGRKPGDYKSGMLNMRQQPHNELHTAMDYVKDEFNEAEWAAKVGKTKTVDDLLVLWRDTIQDNIVPNAQNAISIDKLDDAIKPVSPKFSGSKKPSKEVFKQLSIH